MASSQQGHHASESSSPTVQTTTDRFTSTIQDLVSQVCSRSSVHSVFGEPVTRDDVTLIPVASVIAGFGGGAGAGADAEPRPDGGKGSGMGVGGGFIVQPWGVWEITPGNVRFRRAQPRGLLSTLLDIATALLRRSV